MRVITGQGGACLPVYGNVLNMKDLLTLAISLTFLLVLSSTLAQGLEVTEEPPPVRYKDDLFGPHALILDRNVTCSSESDGDYKFAERTWSCYNLQVDGLRVRSYFFDGADQSLTGEGHCTDNNDGQNELPALCQHLLQAHGINASLSATLVVSDPVCSLHNHTRIMMTKIKPSETAYQWTEYKAGKGFVRTLRCMVDSNPS